MANQFGGTIAFRSVLWSLEVVFAPDYARNCPATFAVRLRLNNARDRIAERRDRFRCLCRVL